MTSVWDQNEAVPQSDGSYGNLIVKSSVVLGRLFGVSLWL